MLLAEYAIVALSVDALDLQEVVRTPSTLDMERDHAAGVLALDTSALVTLSANDALQVESLYINLAHPNGGLWRNRWTWDPHGAAEVHPLVERVCRRYCI